MAVLKTVTWVMGPGKKSKRLPVAPTNAKVDAVLLVDPAPEENATDAAATPLREIVF
jgi:exosome complex RNA-binding protein Rrp42 (RNase PH superfamily)